MLQPLDGIINMSSRGGCDDDLLYRLALGDAKIQTTPGDVLLK